jgi:hypothetical protein
MGEKPKYTPEEMKEFIKSRGNMDQKLYDEGAEPLLDESGKQIGIILDNLSEYNHELNPVEEEKAVQELSRQKPAVVIEGMWENDTAKINIYRDGRALIDEGEKKHYCDLDSTWGLLKSAMSLKEYSRSAPDRQAWMTNNLSTLEEALRLVDERTEKIRKEEQ